MKRKATIIGSGFSSLSSACYLADAGYDVHVYEQGDQLGGRARVFEHEGFKFDMGPTWYWMPDVFERFFSDLGKSPEDYYKLTRLTPAYKVFFGKEDTITIEAELKRIVHLFESIEEGAGKKLETFLAKAERNYKIAMQQLVYKPGVSPMELITKDTVLEFNQFFTSIRSHISKNFKDHRLRQVLEFPVLFLGAKPSDTPLFYSFMNYADFVLGTWHPTGGMKSVVDGIVQLADDLGVTFHMNSRVESINTNQNNEADSITVNGERVPVEILVSGADYKHTESLLPNSSRMYSNKYWNNKTMAPSALLFYVGFDGLVENVEHHTLFFDTSFDKHANDIYDVPAWPEEPLFYASFPSKTDSTLAPKNSESGIFLIPLAPDLEDTPELREKYFKLIMKRLEHLTGQRLVERIRFKRSYCVNDFKKDFNSLKGNAYGMANTLLQTAFLRPKVKSSKVKNLFFTGQLTVPGPGVPPSLISGKIASEMVTKTYPIYHEAAV